MPNTRLEALLQGIGNGAQLEQIAADLLVREEYDVDPTGTQGADGGRDALLTRGDENGILHCSITDSWEPKVKDDADKSENRSENFDCFVFMTTADPGTTKRDRVEEELREEYGWRVEIRDLQRLRNSLQGDPANHDLVREHLHIDPYRAFQNPRAHTDEFYEERLERLHQRTAQYGGIIEEYRTSKGGSRTEEQIVEDPPLLAIHLVPVEAFSSSISRSVTELPDIPSLGRYDRYTDRYGHYLINGSNDEQDLFSEYTCFHEDGWAEAITTHTWAKSEESRLLSTIDKTSVEFVQKAISWFQEVNLRPPFFVYLTLIDASDYKIATHPRISSPHRMRPVGTDEFRLGNVRLDTYDADVPMMLHDSLDSLWRQVGWQNGSIHYQTKSSEEGEAREEWDPRE